MDERNREGIIKLKKIFIAQFLIQALWILVKKTVEFWGHLFL